VAYAGRRFAAFLPRNDLYLHVWVDLFSDGAVFSTESDDLLDTSPERWLKAAEEQLRPRSGVRVLGSGSESFNFTIGRAEWLLTTASIRRAQELLASAPLPAPPLDETQRAFLNVATPETTYMDPSPYRVREGAVVFGFDRSVIRREDHASQLLVLRLFDDGLAQLGPRGALLPFEQVVARFAAGELDCAPESGAWLEIQGVGRCEALEVVAEVPEDFLAGLREDITRAQGGPSSVKLCQQAYEEYRTSSDARAPLGPRATAAGLLRHPGSPSQVPGRHGHPRP